MLRKVFQTSNRATVPISGTGSAGMEAMLCNLIEPGDPTLVCINGNFGLRITDMAERYGAELHTLEHLWGEVFAPDEIDDALDKMPAMLVFMVHAEIIDSVIV